MKSVFWVVTYTLKDKRQRSSEHYNIEEAEEWADFVSKTDPNVPNPTTRVVIEEVTQERHTIYRKDLEEEPEKSA